MDNLVEDYGQDVRVVFRAYTAPNFARGEQALEAAFAAGGQGKFWEMHRRLFEHAPNFDRPTLRSHAEALGLDVDKYLDDIDTGRFAGRRVRHRRQAKRLGIVGLPAAFINGRYVAGFRDEKAWHAMVDDELERVKQMLAEGTSRTDLYETLMEGATDRRVSAPDAEGLREELAKKQAEADPTTVQVIAPKADKRYRIEPGNAPTVGPDDAAVVVVEFMDFQCPYCRRAWKNEIRELVDKRKGEVKFAVRNLPLAIHPSAKGAAVAALAAHRQGKFWEYHQKLLDEEGEVGRDVFVRFAKELGLDEQKFVADLDDPKLAEQVREDMTLAVHVGVTGTPGFFVNGRYARGYDPGEVAGMIDEELEKAKEMTAAGVAKGEVFDKIMAEAVQPKDFPNQ
jgi:protein-disulfide isomerase